MSKLKRLVAYGIDAFIVMMIANMLVMFIPANNKYEKSLDEYISVMQDFEEKKINQEEFLTKTNNLVYDMNKETIVLTIVTVVISIGYFVIFNYFMNGQTLGKKAMKLRIVPSSGKLTMNNYLIRSLLINSNLLNILGVILILFLNKKNYLVINDIITYIFGAFYLASFSMILFRKDEKGLHDIITNTKVIFEKELKPEENLEEEFRKEENTKIKDANIIKEKHIKM